MVNINKNKELQERNSTFVQADKNVTKQENQTGKAPRGKLDIFVGLWGMNGGRQREESQGFSRERNTKK